MPPRKKQQSDPKPQNQQEKWFPVPINFTKRQLDGLDEVAKTEKKTRSEVARDAVEYYLSHVNEGKWEAREREITRALTRMEDHLVSLLIKSIRVSGQTLYWTTLPYITGLPKGRLFEKGQQTEKLSLYWAKLTQAGVNQHWNKSAAFAQSLLKTKGLKEIPSNESKPDQPPPTSDTTTDDEENE